MKVFNILRINKIRQLLGERKLQGFIVTSPANIFYLSGFTGTTAVLLITLEACYLFTDFRYEEQAAKEAESFQIIRVDSEPFDEIQKFIMGLDDVGIEEEYVSWAHYRKMCEIFSGIKLTGASDMLKELRQLKDESEIEILSEAVRITDIAFEDIIKKINPGIAEDEIALELEFSLRKMGASGRSFDFIVASGLRSALPHGVATSKKINQGELITLDFGAKYKWYCSDLTRTVFVGQPDEKHNKIYNIVLEAQLAAIDCIKPGMTGKEVDAVAREIISKHGYGKYFGHGLGHAVGLEIHENPRFNTKETKIIEPGMVITVEPGIYLPGWGGVRIEDMVLVTKNGVKVLTQAPKQFIIID